RCEANHECEEGSKQSRHQRSGIVVALARLEAERFGLVTGRDAQRTAEAVPDRKPGAVVDPARGGAARMMELVLRGADEPSLDPIAPAPVGMAVAKVPAHRAEEKSEAVDPEQLK